MAGELDEQFLQSLMLRDPGAGTKGRFEPLMRDYMRLQNEAARRSVEAPDMKESIKAGYETALQGQEQQMAGMALATAIPQFRDIASQTYRTGLAAQGPREMGEGTFTPGQGYTADPTKVRDRLTKAMAAQAAGARDLASAYGQQEDREAGRAHQAAVLAQQAAQHAESLKIQRAQLGLAQAKHAADMAAGKYVTLKGPNDEQILYNPRTREIINPFAGGAGGDPRTTDVLPKRATTEEHNIYSRGGIALQSGATILQQLQDPKMREEFNMTRGVGASIEAATGIPIGSGTPEQKQLRATVMARAYKTINDLAGATLSPQEASKIMQFAPSPRDSVEMIESKLRSAMDIARLERATLRRNYGGDPNAEPYGVVSQPAAAGPAPMQTRAGDRPALAAPQRANDYERRATGGG